MRSLFLLLFWLWLLNSPSLAGEVAKFNQDFEALGAGYRQVIIAFNQDKKELRIKTAENFVKKLDSLVNAYKKPPPHFFEEREWKEVWTQAQNMAKQALEQLKKNDPDDALATFEDLRELLANLRRRNNIIYLQDYIFTYYDRMDDIVNSGFTPTALQENPGRLMELKEQLAVLSYILETIENNAPEKQNNDVKFLAAIEGVARSIENVRQAIESKDVNKIAEEVMKLRPTFMTFFMQHG